MIRIGLVGYGFMGKMHAQCYAATGRAKVAALADVEADRRGEAASKLGCQPYESLQAMLENADIDAVDICTPTYLHEEHVIAAARAGRHIFCEKPLSLSVESCDAMIGAVEQAGVTMMVGQVVRFWPEYAVIKQLVDSGEYGRVLWASLRRLSPPATWAWQDWLADPARSGGAILDLHIHDLDFITYLVGPPSKVLSRAMPGSRGALDTAMTLGWGHAGGANSYAEGSLTMRGEFPFSASAIVECEKASIRLDITASPSLMVFPSGGAAFAPEVPSVGEGASAEAGGNVSSLGGDLVEIGYFLDCLESNRRPEIVTPDSARTSVKISLAARKSAQSGEPVAL